MNNAAAQESRPVRGPAVDGGTSRVVIRAMLFLLSSAVILAASAPLGARLSGRWPELAVGAVAAIGTFLLTVACVRWDRLTLDDVGAAANRSSLFRLAIGFLIGLTLVALWAQISAMAGGVRWVRTASVGGMAPLISLITYLALACREELAFRGYPLRRLYAALGLWPAQIVVAVVFVLEHRLGGYPWVDAVFGSGMGALLFGMAAIATGGLAIPIGIHAAWNFGSWAVGIKGTPGFWRPVVLQAEAERAHIAGTVIYDVLFILATILFWIWHRRRTVIFRDAGSDDTRRQIGKCST